MNNNHVTFISTLKLIIFLTLAGPIMLAAVILTGGNLLDGFMGTEKTNSLFQDILFVCGLLFTIGGPFAALCISLFRAVRNTENDKRYWYLILIPLFVSALVLTLLYR